jgi:hypothetical protein
LGPTTKADGADTLHEDSYVELGLLQHLSFRDEEDQMYCFRSVDGGRLVEEFVVE